MTAKLYVGNLDYAVTNEQLVELFSQAGKVLSAMVIIDRYSGRSKGFAFVEMESKQAAQKAINLFNGKDFQGRSLVVNEARPREPRGFPSPARKRERH